MVEPSKISEWEVLSNFTENFDSRIATIPNYAKGLLPKNLEIFQINITSWCNQACRHCHVDASPNRKEMMDWRTMETCLRVIAEVPTIHTVDITGGAPEGNPEFRRFVQECKKLGKHVIDRCNLTILEDERYSYLYEFLFENNIELCCSLPYFRKEFTDKQRGDGVFEKSIYALQKLMKYGYGRSNSHILNLVYNPIGMYISSTQEQLEKEFKLELMSRYGISFHKLYCINNMPINRFQNALLRQGKLHTYLEILFSAFNSKTLDGLMCRSQISVGYDGTIYDCDFNQMLKEPVQSSSHINDFELMGFLKRRIKTNNHCFACTAGSGSSCSGGLV